MKKQVGIILAISAALLTGCATESGLRGVDVGGDYSGEAFAAPAHQATIEVYGDRTIVKTNSGLTFYDFDLEPISTERMDGYYLLPNVPRLFYIEDRSATVLVRLDPASRVYSMEPVQYVRKKGRAL